MLELYVFDRNINTLGEISEYDSLEIEQNYYDVSKLTLRVPKSTLNVSLLKVNNILVPKDNLNYGYIIQHFSLVREDSDVIEVFAYSLNWLLSYRSIRTQMRFSGEVVRVMENFIRYNCIEVEASRRINNLTIVPSDPVNINVDSSRTGETVLNHLLELGKEFELTSDVLINYQDKNFYTNIYRGRDLSINQTTNNPLIFSQEFDNVLQQTYFESIIDYKNVAIVAGEGEGVNRTVVEANGIFNGLDRREIYIDARDLQSTYTDENDVEVTLPPEQYRNLLIQRGLEALRDYNRIETFETTIDDVQYKVGVDYKLGDLVTFIDRELGLQMNVRVTKIAYSYSRDGITIKPSFGTGIPTRN